VDSGSNAGGEIAANGCDEPLRLRNEIAELEFKKDILSVTWPKYSRKDLDPLLPVHLRPTTPHWAHAFAASKGSDGTSPARVPCHSLVCLRR
jgi:hypothetical protein